MRNLVRLAAFLSFFAAIFFSCSQKTADVSSQRRYLSSDFGCTENEWQFFYNGKWYPATVPGNIHDDLLANGLIPDPYFGTNETDLQWISDSIWIYRLSFDKYCGNIRNFAHNNLIFEGLDTYAEVLLNGNRLISESGDSIACNMFRQWSFKLPDDLPDTGNMLVVKFFPSTKFDSIKAAKLPYQLPDNRVFTRKAQYENGWDWGPKLNTCGIWKNVYVQSWNGYYISDFYVKDSEPTTKSGRPWIADVDVEIFSDGLQTAEILLSITDEDGYNQEVREKVNLREGKNKASIQVAIENPKLWWPNGMGEQHLYYFSISTTTQNADNKINIVHSHGLRTIKLVQQPDSIGESFQFFVNDKPFFARGANWIPASSFPGTLARNNNQDVYYELLKRCKDANMNMVRIWGGGFYEHDEFYNLCDRFGLLVWQDFMFACNIYPADENFCENVRIEAEEQVKRLRNHASIAIFCGNNEVHNGLEDWGWQKQFEYSDKQYADFYADYDRLFNKILREVLVDNYLNFNYIHSSPTYGWGHSECTTHGCSHYWGVWWGELPFDVWREKTGRFMTEYGFQSYPEMATIEEFTTSQERFLNSPSLQNHQKHARGVQIITKAIEELYGNASSTDLQKFTYLSQLTQSDGIAQAIETHRRQHDRCSGTLFWQINDCWPVASWSCIDYFGRPKALYYKLLQLFDNIAIVSEKNPDGDLELFVVNDSIAGVSGVCEWKIVNILTGQVLASDSANVSVKSNSVERFTVCKIPDAAKNRSEICAVAEFRPENSKKRSHIDYFVAPKDLKLSKSDNISVKTEYFDFYALITLSSKSLQKGVVIREVNNAIVEFSDNYFDLLPGETKQVIVNYPNFNSKPTFSVLSWNKIK